MTPPGNPLLVVERFGYVSAAVNTIIAAAFWGWSGLVAAAAGAAIACSNLWLMRRLLDRALREAATAGAEVATRRLLGGLALKTPIFAFVIYVAVVHLGLDPGAFVLGWSSLIVALVFGGLYLGYRDR